MSINLSLSSINNKAPYPVHTLNGYSFLFTTQYGLEYEVGFVEDYMLSDDGLVFQFFITAGEYNRSPRDGNVYMTVVAILEEFFRRKELSVVYICDRHDGRQSIRQRLFRIWLSNYYEKDLYELVSKTLTVEDIGYTANLLIRKDSPLLSDRKEALEALYSRLEGK